ncbi:ABC transporter permease [Pseudalkalibacillus sp. A8]|uniref:ABC transporter permease n=1 Tax=Pseudalkalibacillus sp. A8 TaxID=3382641 RepID=UPI0038B59113
MSDIKLNNTTVANSPGTEKSLNNIGDILRKFGPVIVLVALVILNIFITNNFLASQTLWNVLLHVSTTALVAIGMTLVISTGGIDLSVGAVMAVSAVTSALLIDSNIFVIIGASILVGSLIGLFNGSIISYFGVQPIIITLATMIAGRGVAQVISDGYLISFDNPTFEVIGKGTLFGVIPTPVVIMLSIAFLMYVVVKYTSFGRYVEAIGDNEKAANFAGVNIRFIKISVYVIIAVLASLAGIVETSRLAAADATRIGELIELDAIAAVVIGGTLMTGGRPFIWGTVIGAVLMGLISTTFNMNNIPDAYSLIFKAVIIVAAIYIQRER